jgi:uncharacterized membrane protein
MAAVMLSAVLHAAWNYLLRRAGGNATVAALGIITEALLLIPFAIVAWNTSGGVAWATFVPAVAVAALLALGNYEALMAAYRRADMSFVYPVARGGVFLFLPLLGFLVFDERLNAIGWLSVVLIVAGIMMLPMARLDRPSFAQLGRHMKDRAMVYALIAAAFTAAYTVWDKFSIGFLDTVLYFAGYTILLGIWFLGVLARTPRQEVRDQLRQHGLLIVAMGFLIGASYLLVLVALRDGMSTQVLAVRQLSIPVGVILGWQLLSEPLTPPRALGAAAITTGCILAAAM